MTYVKPTAVIDSMADGGVYKATLPWWQVVLRAALGAMFLGAATSLAGTAAVQTGVGLVGALLFPVGFVIVILLGLELVTGSFALVPLAVWLGRATPRQMGRSFGSAILGHAIGGFAFAGAFWAFATDMGTNLQNPLAVWIRELAEHKTTHYASLGVGAGLFLVFLKAVLCNWLVATGVVMGMTSTSTGGKIAAMWLPVMLFFGLGLEHAVVNFFVIPAGMLVGADITVAQWWLWNEIPALLGNLVGAVSLTTLGLYLSHRPAAPWLQR